VGNQLLIRIPYPAPAAISKAGIQIPFPQRNVHVRSGRMAAEPVGTRERPGVK